MRVNLEHALRRQRRDANNEPLLIWIDAICINQQDGAEKSDQISKVRLIFETCHNGCGLVRIRIFRRAIVPDYSKSVEEVYVDLIRFQITRAAPGHALGFFVDVVQVPRAEN